MYLIMNYKLYHLHLRDELILLFVFFGNVLYYDLWNWLFIIGGLDFIYNTSFLSFYITEYNKPPSYLYTYLILVSYLLYPYSFYYFYYN